MSLRRVRIISSFVFILATVGTVTAFSLPIPPSRAQENFAVRAVVDQRVELMSIIARLAGYPEYVRNEFKLYAGDVDKHFGPHKQHPAVEFAVKIRESNGVSFDAVMAMAVHLDPPPMLTSRLPFSAAAPERRWGKDAAEQFAKLLRQFYKDADCETFFKQHADLYRTAGVRFQQVLDKVDFPWYKRFYGEVPQGTFNLYIGLLNGGGNYGPKVVHPDGKEDLYAIIGTWQTDSAGLPSYDEKTLPTIVHEYNHSFINHLVHARQQQFNTAGAKIYPPIAVRMEKMAYGSWQTTIQESLVRAAVLRYEFEHNPQPQITEAASRKEIDRGFLWMDELFVLLGVYENCRDRYPTFRSFFPLIEGYYTDLARRIDYKTAKYDELRPRVTAIAPFSNGAQNVEFGLTQLTINFDKPLIPKNYSFNNGQGGKEHSPIEKVVGFNETGTAITLQVKLKPDWDYEFILTDLSFRSKDGYPLQPYTVKFKTRKAVN